jgi:hypothetical protein
MELSPKEKARELYDKHYSLIRDFVGKNDYVKEVCIIAVDLKLEDGIFVSKELAEYNNFDLSQTEEYLIYLKQKSIGKKLKPN